MGDDLYFSLVRGGPFARVREALGLVPDKGLGLARRALAVIAIAWLPVVIAALLEGRLLEGSLADPLLRHYGIHARFLLAIPALLVAEALMEKLGPLVMRQFVIAGLIDQDSRPAFVTALRKAERLRDSRWGGAVVLAGVGLAVFMSLGGVHDDEMAWAGGTPIGGVAATWYRFVSRPVFVLFIGVWVWRLLTGWYLLARLSQLPLRLVPSHPDRAGGLGFMENLGVAAAPLVFALTVVLAGRWAHEIQFHGVHVKELQPLMITYAVAVLVLFLGPTALLFRNLLKFKRQSLLEYGTLVGHQGRMIHRKWIEKQAGYDEAILRAPEIGPMADAITMYNVVERMKPAPIGPRSLVPIVVAMAIPILPVVAIEIPVKELLQKLAGSIL